MMRPPRTAEVLLQSLGAPVSFREPLLGDLAEGFAFRVERDGLDAGRRWYYRETIRATPYLLGEWLRSLRAPDIRYLAGVVVTSYFFTMMLAFLGVALVRVAADALGFPPLLTGRLFGAHLLTLWLPAGIICTVVGGYIAAGLDRRAPLASAIALGVTWSVSVLATWVITHVSDLPVWYWVCLPVLQVLGPTVGGVLRLRVALDPVE